MEITGDTSSFIVLCSHQSARQFSKLFRLVEDFCVSLLKLMGPHAHLVFESVGEVTKPLLTSSYLFLCYLSLGDVTPNFRRPDYTSVPIFHWRNRQRDVQYCAVFAHAHSFEMIYTFSSFESIDNHCFFISAIRRNDKSNVLSDSLLGRVAEYPLCSGIPTRNNSI